jgi:electron transport complex protein RnfC
MLMRQRGGIARCGADKQASGVKIEGLRIRPMRSEASLTEVWPNEPPVFVPAAMPARLRVPLSARPLGAALLPRATGWAVAPGDRLCDASPAESHLALATLAGTLAGSTDARVLGGSDVGVAEIDVAADASIAPLVPETPIAWENVQRLMPAEKALWIDRIRAAGICSDRRSSPDLIGQLNSSLKRTVDVIVCNLLDSDPTACLSSALAARFPEHVAAGTAALMRLTAARQGLLVIDRAVPASWWPPLKKICRDLGLKLVWLFNAYPQGDPTPLLFTLLGQRMRPNQLPTQCGAMVIDAAAALAIGNLVLHERPMLSVPVVLRDHTRRVTHFRIAPVGTPVRWLLEKDGIDDPRLVLRSGDILRDQRDSGDAIIGCSELILHATVPPKAERDPDPCIRCGWCVELCPTRCHPAALLEAAQRRSAAQAERAGLEACIECGICVYVCPSHLPLLDGIRSLRVLDA